MALKKIKLLLVLIALWLIASTWSCGEIPAKELSSAALGKEELVQVSIQKLIVDPATQNPVVTLLGPDKKRVLFIWIGPSEARAIYAELQGTKHFRPLTHDLLAGVINEFNSEVHRIVITHAKENVFYATILLEKDGRLVEIDARPSDSLVMALKFKAPVFVAKTLFEQMALPMEDKAEIGDEYGLSLQELTPELSEYLSFSPKRGVMVSGIRKGSQAAKDGLKTGDIIVDIGGQVIENELSMKKIYAETDEPVDATIFRNSRFMTFRLHLP
jgi:bifunctional DNase/RNase